ncbi:DUF4825 domain-containing protein [Paenibacillus segetis]|uniref:DUF4825 domain-containing protein n=1 Tax=Paenibacillus segetis TaxID=1325360 RepID=A0ABQ1YA27_9BACL|nr:DUF4825 domain-containing protein [Paenibacillus segetis]GGH18359.1 hypothetical protein GCM10008013_14280 [Paenibacillus segetis]
MKTRNTIIIILLMLGIGLFTVVQGWIIPQQEQDKQRYIMEQQSPLTHDIGSVLKFKSKYMGDFSNFDNLISSLPLNRVDRSYQLYPEQLTAQINYEETVLGIGQERVELGLIYNATAAFALIDNLEGINFNFMDVDYQVKRQDVENWYGTTLSALLVEDTWGAKVQEKLADDEYVLSCSKALLSKSKIQPAS